MYYAQKKQSKKMTVKMDGNLKLIRIMEGNDTMLLKARDTHFQSINPISYRNFIYSYYMDKGKVVREKIALLIKFDFVI